MIILDIFERIKKQCDSSLYSINSVNSIDYLKNDELKNIRDLVIKQAFLSVFTEWEHFLEDSTISYALGNKSIKDYPLIKYISPTDEEHANKLIKGTSAYPDWSKMDVVINLEESLFKDGAPLSSPHKEVFIYVQYCPGKRGGAVHFLCYAAEVMRGFADFFHH